MAECIVIEGEKVELRNGEAASPSATVEQWLQQVNRHSVRGLTAEPIADHVKWRVAAGGTEIFIVQLDPVLRVVQWIDRHSPVPFGPEATTSPRSLATPYVILKVPFRRKRVIHRVEVFYRNQPLSAANGPGGELFWPNLLNVSPHAHGCTAWLCTQFLDRENSVRGITAGLNAVVHHLWGGPFNLSSEAHEGASTFSKAQQDGLDARVTDVERWQEESLRDARFPLSVAWRPTGLDVQKLILSELSFLGVELVPRTAAALANHLLRCKRATSGDLPDED